MLKRISNSFTKDSTGRSTNDLASALLIPPPASSPLLLPPSGARPPAYGSPRSSPSPAASPTRRGGGSSFPFPATLQQQQQSHQTRPGSRQGTTPADDGAHASSLIDRTVLHKTLTNLATLLVALDELRDASQTQSRARKRVAKASRDLATGFSSTKGGVGAAGACREVEDAFKGCAMMMDSLYEVEERHAKALRKEYEALNEAVARYFRRTAVSPLSIVSFRARRFARTRPNPVPAMALRRKRRKRTRTSSQIWTNASPKPRRRTTQTHAPQQRLLNITSTSL